MARSFTTTLHFDGTSAPASILTQLRQDGLYYEVNVRNFPRFRMRWSELGRFDIVEEDGVRVPYSVVLAASEAIEKQRG
jgi:hypothetical protein